MWSHQMTYPQIVAAFKELETRATLPNDHHLDCVYQSLKASALTQAAFQRYNPCSPQVVNHINDWIDTKKKAYTEALFKKGYGQIIYAYLPEDLVSNPNNPQEVAREKHRLAKEARLSEISRCDRSFIKIIDMQDQLLGSERSLTRRWLAESHSAEIQPKYYYATVLEQVKDELFKRQSFYLQKIEQEYKKYQVESSAIHPEETGETPAQLFDGLVDCISSLIKYSGQVPEIHYQLIRINNIIAQESDAAKKSDLWWSVIKGIYAFAHQFPSLNDFSPFVYDEFLIDAMSSHRPEHFKILEQENHIIDKMIEPYMRQIFLEGATDNARESLSVRETSLALDSSAFLSAEHRDYVQTVATHQQQRLIETKVGIVEGLEQRGLDLEALQKTIEEYNMSKRYWEFMPQSEKAKNILLRKIGRLDKHDQIPCSEQVLIKMIQEYSAVFAAEQNISRTNRIFAACVLAGYHQAVERLLAVSQPDLQTHISMPLPNNSIRLKSLLGVATYFGHESCLKALLDAGCEMLREEGRDQLIHIAVKNKNINILRTLLDAGYHLYINSEDKEYEFSSVSKTPLMIASEDRNTDILSLLLQKGAYIPTSYDLQQILSNIVGHNDQSCLQILFEYGLDTEIDQMNRALMLAAQQGHLECLRLLIAHGADINAKSSEHETPLILASKYGHLSCVEALVQAGAVFTPPLNKNGIYVKTALEVAFEHGHLDVLKLLIEEGAGLDAEPGYEFLSRSQKQKECVDYIIQSGSYHNRYFILQADRHHAIKDLLKDGKTQSYLAELRDEAGFDACVAGDDLHQHDQDLIQRFFNNDSAYLPCTQAELLSFLQSQAPDYAAVHLSHKNYSCLQKESEIMNSPIWQSFIQQKLKQFEQELPLNHAAITHSQKEFYFLRAAEYGQYSLFKTLLDLACNPNMQDRYFAKSALMLAAAHGHVSIVTDLIALKVGLDVVDHKQNTALIYAAQTSDNTCLKMLVDAGADVHHTNIAGYSALLIAASSGHEESVYHLTKAGASLSHLPEAQNELYQALRNNNQPIFRLLVQSGASLDSIYQTDIKNILQTDSAYKDILIEGRTQRYIQKFYERAGLSSRFRIDHAQLKTDQEILNRFFIVRQSMLPCTLDELLAHLSFINRSNDVVGLTPHAYYLIEQQQKIAVSHEWRSFVRKQFFSEAQRFAAEPESFGQAECDFLIKAGMRYGDRQSINLLLESGIDVNSQDSLTGDSLLHKALANQNADAVLSLLEHGASVFLKNKKGQRVDAQLHAFFFEAVRKGDTALVLALIKNHIPIDTINKLTGETALLMALRNEQVGLVIALLQQGANTKVVDKWEKSFKNILSCETERSCSMEAQYPRIQRVLEEIESMRQGDQPRPECPKPPLSLLVKNEGLAVGRASTKKGM